MNSIYLVELKPIGSFFFGSERTFGIGKDNEHYIIKSEILPQQTSILGMLRKEFLIRKNLIREDWDYSGIQDKVNKIIGSESFDVNSIKNQQFGVIEKIHPVFIKRNDKYLISVPKDHKVQNKTEQVKEQYVPYKFYKDKSCIVNFGNSVKKNKIIHIPYEYDSKKGLASGFMYEDKNIISFDDVFKEDKQIGIKLNNNRQTSENGLYKIIRYRLQDNYEFAFNLEVNFSKYFKESDLNEYTNIISLGGEGSYFKISFKKVDHYITDNFKNINKSNSKQDEEIYKKVILLSNTYISRDKYEQYCEYGIIKGVTFRNLKTNYNKFKEREKYYRKFEKTDKFIFLERGSVLFSSVDNYENLKRQIEVNKNVRKIGYNQYI